MQTAGTAKREESKFSRVKAPFHRNHLDGPFHSGVSDIENPLGQFGR